ncbi:hypothetical protein F66182_6101 [Fusarium sp. NRRL 66182]|nr:hypothetical protein F66182_6101 [Fusarium sp. NRRL 66182]
MTGFLDSALRAFRTALGMSPELIDRPPPYQEATATDPGPWELTFLFTSDPDTLRTTRRINTRVGWRALMIITTHDIVGLMRDGLYLSQDNVQPERSFIKQCWWPTNQEWSYLRCYAVVDPKWSGHLIVQTLHLQNALQFRVSHLSEDKVAHAHVLNKKKNLVYSYDVDHPENNGNYILEDTPMEGLWPWPRREPGAHAEDDGKRGKE